MPMITKIILLKVISVAIYNEDKKHYTVKDCFIIASNDFRGELRYRQYIWYFLRLRELQR